MTAALIWKEWRQQRPLVFTALAAALLLPLFTLVGALGGYRLDSLTQVLPALQLMVIVPVFAAATGALSFADDHTDNTLGFLLSRPASRARVWAVKVGVAFAVLIGIAILTHGVSMLLAVLIGGPTMAELVPARVYPGGFRPLGGGGTRTFVMNAVSQSFGVNPVAGFLAFTFSGPGFLLILFGASVFWSTRTKRPLHAMLAGLITAIVLNAAQTLIAFGELQAGGAVRLYPHWPIILFLALLAASYFSFETTEPATT